MGKKITFVSKQRFRLVRFNAVLLSLYILSLSILSLQHSFDHYAGKEINSIHLDDTLSVIPADSSGLICELCDFFQNQVFYFSQEKAVTFITSPVLLPIEKLAAFTLFELFNQHLRGPPAYV